MKFLIAITLICALAFSTVNSETCTSTDNPVSWSMCKSFKTACDQAVENCDTLWSCVGECESEKLGAGLCKDKAINGFDKAVAAQVADCECEQTCTTESSGATFAVMSLMAFVVATILP